MSLAIPPRIFNIQGPGTEYVLELPHLLPAAVDRAAMQTAAKALMDADPSEPAQAAAAVSNAAFMYLCSGDALLAKQLLNAVIAHQISLEDRRGRIASELRLVQTLQRLGETTESTNLAYLVVDRVRSEGPNGLLHYSLHHLGKALIQDGKNTEARIVLGEALSLRNDLRDESLIESTLAALALIPATEA